MRYLAVSPGPWIGSGRRGSGKEATKMVGRPSMRLRNITIGLALCLALFVAAPAFAQSSAENGYSQPAGIVHLQVGPSGSEAHSAMSSEGGQLPFTVLDIVLMAAAAG